MNLAIIGAGESSRLKAEGLKIPKHLIKLNGEYLIERIIRIGGEKGFDKVFCIINSHEPELKNYLLNHKFNISVSLIVKDTESSMHSLFEMSQYLSNEPFCLATTDTVFLENEFSNFINYCKSTEKIDGILAITKFIDDEKPLCVSLDNENNIINFSDSKEGYFWATGGIYYFSNRIFELLPEALNLGIARLRNFLRLLIRNNYKLKAYSFSKIVDIDHVKDIKIAEELISSYHAQLEEKK
ncbi:NTP transferase domain-containing protein [Melioribacteraceae bacterium 4301-Me]|uniref:NTP transferase domain-containing protein n=1 Tax=Pyranulibacter aquaticus TaxID=3163344 RepID=UPI0035976FC5